VETQGFVRGNLTYRNLLTDAATRLETRLVKRAALSEALPRNCLQVTGQERIDQLQARYDAIRRRYHL
jgi:hypothetical protein